MIIHKEIGSIYHHKPIVQGVDYSPLMIMNSVEALVKEERRPEAIPAAVPPPIFLRRWPADSLFHFFNLCLAHLRDRGRDTFKRWF